MTQRLAGKVALVTGAARGIGAAIASASRRMAPRSRSSGRQGSGLPPSRQVNVTYKRAPRAKAKGADQLLLAAEPDDDSE